MTPLTGTYQELAEYAKSDEYTKTRELSLNITKDSTMKISFNTQLELTNNDLISLVAYMQSQGLSVTKGSFKEFITMRTKEFGSDWPKSVSNVVLSTEETMVAWAVASKFTKDGIPVPTVPVIEA